MERELPQRRHATQQSNTSALNCWIRSQWGDHLVEQVTPAAVEQWLRSLPRAPKTKLNLRSVFHVLYGYALRWNLAERNPIALVRESGGRRSIPRIFTPCGKAGPAAALRRDHAAFVSPKAGARPSCCIRDRRFATPQWSVILPLRTRMTSTVSKWTLPLSAPIPRMSLHVCRGTFYTLSHDRRRISASGSPREIRKCGTKCAV